MKVVSSLLSGVVLCAALAPGTSMAAPRQMVNQRRENQQDRINQGIRSGELTRKEAGNLEAREARIRNNERFDKRQDHGKLTNGQRASLNRQLNKASRNIYRDKHNNRTQK